MGWMDRLGLPSKFQEIFHYLRECGDVVGQVSAQDGLEGFLDRAELCVK